MLYSDVADNDGSDPLSQGRVYRHRREQSLLGVTESRHTGGGKSVASRPEHRLMRGTDIVLRAVSEQ